MTTPKISIIIPIYKAEKYLERCLDSILAQSFVEWECILVEDGSPDSSGNICDTYSYKDNRFRVIHKKNEGVSIARQTGLEISTGVYCTFVDPDDWVESSMLSELYNEATDKNADLVICDFYQDETSQSKYRKQEPSALDQETVLLEMIAKLKGSCWNKLYKTSTIKENRVIFPEDLSFCEDLYFNLSFLQFDIKIAYLDKAFYHYVKFENQNSLSTPINTSFEQDLLMFKKFRQLLKGPTINRYYSKVYSTRILRRNLHRGKDSNFAFMKHCFPLLRYIDKAPKNILVYGLSSLGFYHIIRRII